MTDFAIDVARAAERADPSGTAGKVKVYTKDIAGITHAYAVDGSGAVQQLTPVTLPTGSTPYSALSNLLTVGPHTGLNQSAAQKVFDNSTITLIAGMKYKMRGHYTIDWGGTTAGMTMSLLFGGTATFTSFGYVVDNVRTTPAGGLIAMSQLSVATAAATVCTTSSTTQLAMFRFEGFFTVNTGGTFIPQFQTNATPTQVPVVQASSYLELIPLGAGFTSQGGWG